MPGFPMEIELTTWLRSATVWFTDVVFVTEIWA